MNSNFILDKSLVQWKNLFPLLDDLISTKEVFWANPKYKNFSHAINKIELSLEDVKDAEARLQRFSSYISKVFPDTKPQNGLIESPIKHIPNMKKYLESISDKPVQGSLYLKCDSHLAISGSIKARGGIYEVLKHAEDLAMEKGLLNVTDDYSIMDSAAYRDFFSDYTIAVGSTGNLGLSIGIMSAKLGFKVFVHMSADAKQWKKDLLRSKGVTVVEYESDYSKAVEEGRKQSDLDPNSYFVDDENSINLFLGYAVAALRLQKQLSDSNVTIDSNNPLFVYLPCGVGGGPGGVAFGLKLIFGDNVHCFFAEPTHSPCMLIGCMTGYHDKVCVQDFGIDNITAADGLAVGRASGFVGRTLHELLSGDYTVDDDRLYILLHELANREKIYLEPSALAGVYGPVSLFSSESGQIYLKSNELLSKLDNITHIAWATGGSMVPENEMKKYYKKGSKLTIKTID